MAEDIPDEEFLRTEDIATALLITMTQLIRSLDPETRQRFAIALARQLEFSEIDPLIPSTQYNSSRALRLARMFVEASNSD